MLEKDAIIGGLWSQRGGRAARPALVAPFGQDARVKPGHEELFENVRKTSLRGLTGQNAQRVNLVDEQPAAPVAQVEREERCRGTRLRR